MKKYFVLALALAAFAVAPVFADVTVGGEFSAAAMWELDEEDYVGHFDKIRLYLSSNIDDYNTFEGQIRANYDDNAPSSPSLYFNRFLVKTEWAKFFGFDDVVGIKTTFGYHKFTTNDALSYTIYDIGGGEPYVKRRLAGKIDFNIMDIVKPYFATTMKGFDDIQGKDVMEFVAGVGVDFAPVWFEAYFLQNGPEKDSRQFGIEAEFSMELQNDMALRVAGVLEMRNSGVGGWLEETGNAANDADEWSHLFKIMAGFSAYGATIDLAFFGAEDALGALAISAKYDVLDFFGIQAGTKFAFSDYKEVLANDEAFMGCEFGVYLTPGGKVRYDIGYVFANEDAMGGYFIGGTPALGSMNYKAAAPVAPVDIEFATLKGGLYFAANAKF